MTETAALLLTDLVDSSALSAELGDAAMATVWAQHDRIARDLLARWRGREVDKSDGFLLLFPDPADALGYALAYHRALAAMVPPLRARAGLHVGEVSLRPNPAEDVARGAKPFEVDGISKPVAARVMSAALGGQTLVTRPAVDALQAAGALPDEAAAGPGPRRVHHGFWCAKGLPEAFELAEIGEPGQDGHAGAPFEPPPDSAKVWRVVRREGLWLPVREVSHSLPAERDAFVGRRAALRELGQRLDEGTRLVSVLGIGGSGKTRLVQHFGWTRLGEFPGGVWFCDLAAARGADGVVHAVAAGLGLSLGAGDPVAQIGHAVAGRGECLLVLDTFEQVARHAAATLGAWLDRAPAARFVATTREVLGLPGETTLALPPLAAAEGEALFLKRGAAARSGFAPSGDELAAVAPLVRLLDGLPLAIELAAARVRVMSPRALLARMDERFRLLASAGGRHDRQATLRATFDWSWELLSAAEKATLAQLSVFEGGFALEAAEAVVDLAAVADAPWTVDALHSLVDKSFVRVEGDERFALLGSVQAYAAEHLAAPGHTAVSGPAGLAAAHARHAAWFAALGPRRAVSDRAIDLDNLAIACRRATLAGQAELAAGALEGAWAALALHGPFSAAVDLADMVAALPGLGALGGENGADDMGAADIGAAPPAGLAVVARVHTVRAAALDAAGRREQALAACDLALQAAARAGLRRCAAEAGVTRGGLLLAAGQADAAVAQLQAALADARAAGEPLAEVAALNALGHVAFGQGRMDEAQRDYEAALARADALGDRRWQGALRGNLGNLHASLGRLDRARGFGEAALADARAVADRLREGNQLANLAMMALIQGRLADADALCAEGLAVAQQIGHVRLQGAVLSNAGLVREAQGDAAEAERRFDAAVAVARQMGDRRWEGQFLGHIGRLQARRGDAPAALATLDQAQSLLQAVSDRLGLGQLLCARAEAEAAAGRADAAQAALQQARTLAAEAGASGDSELGQALAESARRLAAAA